MHNSDKCIICGSLELKSFNAEFCDFIKERMFHNKNCQTNLLYCPNCQTYYASNRPSKENYTQFYTGYRNDEYQKQRESFDSYYTKSFHKDLTESTDEIYIRKKIIEDLIKEYIPTETINNVLDYGGDTGQCIPDIFSNVQRYVYDVSGAQTKEGIISITDINKLKNLHWDLIMCNHVLEHISYPMELINNLVSLMPIGGYLYIEVPFEDYMEAIIQTGGVVPIHEHINFFRIETFEKIFADCHFTQLAINYIDIPQVKGSVFRKHIQCLIKKVIPDNTSILLKQIKKLNHEIEEYNRLENTKLQKLENLLDNNTKAIEKIDLNINCINKKIQRTTLLQQIFSITNEKNHKVLRLLGIKFKYKRKLEI